MSKVQAVPERHQTITPHLVIQGASEAIDFYKKAFGAEEVCRMPGPDGKAVMHAELKIGTSHLFLCEEFPHMGAQSPKGLGGSPVTINLYVENADKVFNAAVKAGAEVTMPLENMFWGDRYGKLRDPFGHQWAVATHIEDVTPEEMQRRAAALFGGQA